MVIAYDAVARLAQHVNEQFTIVVGTFDESTVINNADFIRQSVSQFLRCATLAGQRVLICADVSNMLPVTEHLRELRASDKGPASAHFLLADGLTDEYAMLRNPQEQCVVAAGERLWAFLDSEGQEHILPPLTSPHRLYLEGVRIQQLRLNSMAGDDILVVRAGIHQTSIKLLIDTGASANFCSAKLAAAMDLHVKPDTQGLQVIMADGSVAAVTGSVIVPVSIGRFKTRINFLVAELNPVFDAVVGYSWIKRNCDLHFSKNMVAFRNGTNVTCVRLPVTKSITPEGRWQQAGQQPAAAGTTPGSLRHQGRTARRGADTQGGGTPLLSAIQLKRLVRKGGETFLLYMKVGQNIVAEGGDTSALVDQILDEFADVFADPPGLPPMRKVAHVAPLIPGSRPPYRRNYRMTEAERAELKKQITELLAKGLIQPSVSPFGAPVIFVKKRDGTLRMCIDYRAVNKLTVRNRFPVPRVEDLLDRLKGAVCFSSLDLTAGYNQIRMHDEDTHKSAFTTPFGHFEYRVLPTGMANSPSIFSALMNDVLAGMEDFILLYIDDVCIFSRSAAEHEKHVRAVLQRLREHELYAKLSKCEFFKNALTFLGHIVSAQGIQVDPVKIQVVKEWPVPQNVTHVRQFVGLANYFRKFVMSFSEMAKPLTDLTRAGTEWKWKEEQQQAFDRIKDALTQAPTLAMPDTQLPYTVICDASNFGIGAVLLQEEHPIAFMSRLLDPAQMNWSVTDRELLAVIEALKLWRCYLGDRAFTVVTDHNPLTFFATKKDLHGRQARWAEHLAMFDFAWEYRPGRTNVADPLSRNPVFLAAVVTRQRPSKSKVGQTVSAADQAPTGPELTDIELAISKGYAFDPIFSDKKYTHRWKLVDGLWLTTDNTIVVPNPSNNAALRQRVIDEHHSNPFSGHCGATRTAELVQRSYWWKGLKQDVQDAVKHCHDCQLNKPSNKKPAGLLQPLSVPDRPWSHISVDFVTGLPSVGPQQYDTITVFVDRLTKMVHYCPCREQMSSADFAQLFMANIFRLHGLPLHIVSDRDPRFTSDFWKEVTTALGMERGFSTAFHPQTDGQTERMNRTMEEMLRHFIAPMKGDWVGCLPMLEFAYNNSQHAATRTTPFKLYTGLHPLHPASTLPERAYKVPSAQMFVAEMAADMKRAKQCLLDAQTRMKAQVDKHRRSVTFAVGDSVLLATKNLKLKGDMARKLWPRFIGPFTVTAAIGKVAYRLDLPAHMKTHNVFHVSLLQPYNSDGKRHPPPPTLVDGELEYLVESITAHKVQLVGARNATKRTKVQFLVCWQGFGREHDSWEPAEMLEDCAPLDVYLRQLVRRKEQLPPGFFPDEAEPPAKRGRGASPVPKRVRFKPVDREAAMG